MLAPKGVFRFLLEPCNSNSQEKTNTTCIILFSFLFVVLQTPLHACIMLHIHKPAATDGHQGMTGRVKTTGRF